MDVMTLREIQLAELDILLEFDRICKENGLRYSLAGGTLLGAIRHKGFIPWDDDIDICMPRPDYEKFYCIFTEANSKPNYVLYSDRDSSADYPFLKIGDSSIKIEREGINEVENVWIDIFPIEGIPADKNAANKIYKKAKFYRRILCFSKWKSVSEYSGRHSKLVARLYSIFVKIYGGRRAFKKLAQLAEKYDYNDYGHVGNIIWGLHDAGEVMLKSEFEKVVYVNFEGHKFSALSCWDSYLRGLYGDDYMQLPPEEKRVCHSFKAYRVGDDE